MASAGFSGNAGYTMGVDIGRSGTSVTVGNLHVVKSAGYTGYWTANSYSWSISISTGGGQSGTWTYDFRGNTGGTVARVIFGDTRQFAVGAGRTATVTVTVAMSFGSATVSQQVTIPNTPPAPKNIGVDQATTNSLRYRFSSSGDGGSAVTGWQARYSTNSSMSGATTIASTGTSVVTGLNPGTTYYFQSRGQNAMGWGAWSAVASGQTLPATPPVLTVTPSTDGSAATAKLSPPSGVSGVNEYEIRYTPVGGTSVTVSSTATSKTISGLQPGTGYAWRARARIGTYWSPWSADQTIVQPAAGSAPGSYFDGGTEATTDATYAWAGTAHGSETIVTGRGVKGWVVRSSAGATVRLFQGTGGPAGTFARALMMAPSTASGVSLEVGGSGTDRSAVMENVAYSASVVVRPSRTQRMRVAISWYDSAGTQLLRTEAPPMVVDATWTTLSVAGVAPSGAITAAVRIQDSSADGGVGWSLWQVGEYFDATQAMLTPGMPLPYFDGSTLDTLYYKYDWLGAADESVSERRTLLVPEVDPLADPDCDPVPMPPTAPAIPANCVEDVVEWRTIRFEIPDSEVPRWGAAVPTLILKAGGQAERQVRIRIYPNPEGVAPDLIDANSWEGELILTYIPPDVEMRLDGVSREVWATLPTRDIRPADHLLFGTNGAPAVWPELVGGVGYVVTVDIPVDNPQYNLDVRVLLTQRM